MAWNSFKGTEVWEDFLALIHPIPEKELRGLSPSSYIHVYVSDLYILRIGPHIWLQQIRQTYWKYLSHIYERRNWETEHYNSVL